MNVFGIFILLPVVFCQFFEEELFFYQSSRGAWHANRGDTIMSVTNPEDFGVRHGYALAKFNFTMYEMTLANYTFIQDPDVHVKGLNLMDETTSYNDCPLFGQKVVVAVYRVQNRNDDQTCVSIETVKRYFQYMDSHLRLISAGRIRFDMDNSVISSVCCPCSEEECYKPNNYQTFMNKVQEACKPLDPNLDMRPMTRLFFNGQFGGFAGLASLGWIQSFANYGNYWAINNVNNDPDEMWKWEYNLSVLIHEFGHTMGMGHASYTEESPDYFLKDYIKPDNYGDGGNVMGGGNYWDTVISPSHYYYRLSKEKVEPFWYKTAEDIDRKTIRLFAWDHPYSRPFLGVEAPRFNDDDLIGNIPYKDNMMTLEIPYNRQDMCSTISEDVVSGSFYLEYRNKKGSQQGAAHRGIRLIQGRVNKPGMDQTRSLILSAGVDGLFGWHDSSIPVGVWWHAPDADLGTVGIRLNKIHSVTDRMEESLLDDPVQPLESIPYVELQYSYAPNVKYIPPNQPSPLPTYEFSPNVFGCVMNENVTGWECSVIGPNRMWAYMKPFAHRGHPRVFNFANKQIISTASASVVSFPSRQRMSWNHYYGDTTRGHCSVVINQVQSEGSAEPWLGVKLYRKTIEAAESEYRLIHDGDAVYVRSIKVEEHDEVYLVDMFGYEERVYPDVGLDSYLQLLPSRDLPGLYEGYVIKRREGIPVYANRFTQQVGDMKSDRLAVQIIDDNQVEVSSAAIPSGRYSFPTMLHSRTLKSGEKLPMMFEDWSFGDYLLVDFSGKLPSNLLFYLETDNGDIVFDLGRFSGFSDLTLKVTYWQVINEGSVAGRILKVWFNKQVNVLSIRPVLWTNVANLQGNYNSKEDYFNQGAYRFKGTISGFQGFKDVSYTGSFNGRRYTVSSSEESAVRVRLSASGWNIPFNIFVILIAVVVVVFLLFIVCVIFASVRRRRRELESSNPPPTRKPTQDGQAAPVRKSSMPVSLKRTEPAPERRASAPVPSPSDGPIYPPLRRSSASAAPPQPPRRGSTQNPPPRRSSAPTLPPRKSSVPTPPPKPSGKRSAPPPIPNKNLKPR